MIHFSASICSSDLESIEILQNLVENSPLVISGKLDCNLATTYQIHRPITKETEEKSLCCMIGKESPCFLAYPLCLKVKTTNHVQETHKFQLPAHPLGHSEQSEYTSKMLRAMHDHRVLPVFTLLMKLCNSERKREKLARAALDEKYGLVFREDIDQAKVQLLEEFAKAVGLEFSVEQAMSGMSARMVNRVVAKGQDALAEGQQLCEAIKDQKPMVFDKLQSGEQFHLDGQRGGEFQALVDGPKTSSKEIKGYGNPATLALQDEVRQQIKDQQ